MGYMATNTRRRGGLSGPSATGIFAGHAPRGIFAGFAGSLKKSLLDQSKATATAAAAALAKQKALIQQEETDPAQTARVFITQRFPSWSPQESAMAYAAAGYPVNITPTAAQRAQGIMGIMDAPFILDVAAALCEKSPSFSLDLPSVHATASTATDTQKAMNDAQNALLSQIGTYLLMEMTPGQVPAVTAAQAQAATGAAPGTLGMLGYAIRQAVAANPGFHLPPIGSAPSASAPIPTGLQSGTPAGDQVLNAGGQIDNNGGGGIDSSDPNQQIDPQTGIAFGSEGGGADVLAVPGTNGTDTPTPDEVTDSLPSLGIGGFSPLLVVGGLAVAGGVGYLIFKHMKKPRSNPHKRRRNRRRR